MKVYAEIGIGNESFFSTEIEDGEKEYRIPKFKKPAKINGYYLRTWFLKTVYIISTDQGFKIIYKARNNFKLLLGISGIN